MDYLILSLKVFTVFILVAFNAFFVASEFSIVKMRASRLDALIKEGNHKAVDAKTVSEQLNTYLSVTQLGITLASLGLGWLGEPTVAELLAPVFALLNLPPQLERTLAFVLGFALITALHIVLGELVPKSLSIQSTERIALFVARPLLLCDKLMYPAVWLLNAIAARVLQLLGVEDSGEAAEAHNEEEIRILMEESHKHGYIDKTELTYLDNVFDFAERHAGDIMVPRMDMVCMYLEHTLELNIQVALGERMTRYPICDGDKDHIIGFLHIKDLLRYLNAGEKPDLRQLARPVLVVPESMPISKVLRMLQKRRSQLAIVSDEYGGTAGMITVEDILEEIVGEIRDEFDEERPEVEELGNKAYSVDGKMLLTDVNEFFGLQLDTAGCNTIGGWVYAHVSYPPAVGQGVKTENAEFVVEELEDRRVVRVRLYLLYEPENLHEELQDEYLFDEQ